MEGQNITEWTLEEIKKPKFVAGQTAYYFDDHERPVECKVSGYHGEEIFIETIDGNPIGWFTEDTLFTNCFEAARVLNKPLITIRGEDLQVAFERQARYYDGVWKNI